MSCREQSHAKRCRVACVSSAHTPIAASGKKSVVHTDCCAELCLRLHTELSCRIAEDDKLSPARVSGLES